MQVNSYPVTPVSENLFGAMNVNHFTRAIAKAKNGEEVKASFHLGANCPNTSILLLIASGFEQIGSGETDHFFTWEFAMGGSRIELLQKK